MKYDWENEIKEMIGEVDDIIMQVDSILPKGCTVIGLVVANMETVEAATIRMDDIVGVAGADLWKDALGDVKATYGEAAERMLDG